ncbi:MAG: hypothetical protein ACHQ9S_02135 [Candidatus Binatia bacterium]
MAAEIIDLERVRLLRRAEHAECHESVFPRGAQQWPLCRISYFARATASGRPPRCCCGRVYTDATLRARAAVITGVVRQALRQLGSSGQVTMPKLVAALLAARDLTSVERAALSTGPCLSYPVLARQTRQLRFLWGLYRAYWGRAVSTREPRTHQAALTARQSRQAAADLRVHIRQEISLIRHLQQSLSLCPGARRRPMSGSALRPPGLLSRRPR